MVYIHFPASLTDEEELLFKKYAKLKRKKKALQAAKAPKPEAQDNSRTPAAQGQKRKISESAEDAKEQAKKLIRSGLIKIRDESLEKQSFKRSKNLEKRLKDPEKSQASLSFQPFAATHEEEGSSGEGSSKPKMKGLYDSFVRGDTRFENDNREEPGRDRERGRDRGRDRERERREREPPKKGNTVYVYGHGLTEEILNKAFTNLGTIVNVSMESDKNCGFVTFEQMETADKAIAEMHGSMVSQVQLKVSMARRQPNFEHSQDPSSSSWASIAASHSQKGSHKDKRDLVAYDEEDLF